jgi:SAM-dependent methyltransferase
MPDRTAPPQYSAGDASAYDALAIGGTTYEIGFCEVRRMLGDISGHVFLDFGSGTGRSSRFLHDLGAQQVYGIDHSDEMIRKASARSGEGIVFLKSEGEVPLDTASVDGAISLCVFSEMRRIEDIVRACKEIGRIVKEGGPFVMMSASPRVKGHRFKSFSYATGDDASLDGRTVTCRIVTDAGVLDVQDTLWEEEEYRLSLEAGGFVVEEITYPTGDPAGECSGEETTVAPFVVARGVRR